MEGSGTTFIIYLPSTREKSSPSYPSSNGRPLQQNTKTILCVEDDKHVQEFVSAQLRALGYKTIVVGDGNGALSIIESLAAIDLVFTDIIMPGKMNGWQLADRAKQMQPGLKFLFTSGFSDVNAEHVRNQFILKKPYRRRDLSDAISRALDCDEAQPVLS